MNEPPELAQFLAEADGLIPKYNFGQYNRGAVDGLAPTTGD